MQRKTQYINNDSVIFEETKELWAGEAAAFLQGQVLEFLNAEKPIHAIKLFRNYSDASFKAAKFAIDLAQGAMASLEERERVLRDERDKLERELSEARRKHEEIAEDLRSQLSQTNADLNISRTVAQANLFRYEDWRKKCEAAHKDLDRALTRAERAENSANRGWKFSHDLETILLAVYNGKAGELPLALQDIYQNIVAPDLEEPVEGDSDDNDLSF